MAEVNGKGQLNPKECCGGTAPNLPSGRATLSVSQGEEGRPAAGHQEPRNLGRRTVTVSRKGGTSHFLKYNQRPHYYLHKRRPFQGPTLSPRLAPGPPQKLSGLGPSQEPGVGGLGVGEFVRAREPLGLSLTSVAHTGVPRAMSLGGTDPLGLPGPRVPACRLGAFLPLLPDVVGEAHTASLAASPSAPHKQQQL